MPFGFNPGIEVAASGSPYTEYDLIENILKANHAFFFDDFLRSMDVIGGTYVFPGWLLTLGAGDIRYANNHGINAMGIGSINAAAGATTVMETQNNMGQNSNAGDYIDVEFRVCQAAYGTWTVYQLYAGANDYVEFYLGAAGNWFCRSYVGGVQRVNQNSGVAPTIGLGNWQRLRIDVEFGQVTWYIDGVQVHQDTTPVTNFVRDGWAVRIEANGNGQRHLDWVYCHAYLATARTP